MTPSETQVLGVAAGVIISMVVVGSVWLHVDSRRVKVGRPPKYTPPVKPRPPRLDRDKI